MIPVQYESNMSEKNGLTVLEAYTRDVGRGLRELRAR